MFIISLTSEHAELDVGLFMTMLLCHGLCMCVCPSQWSTVQE